MYPPGRQLYRSVFGTRLFGPTGRVRFGVYLTRMRTAEHLDLADDVMKAAAFELVARSFDLVACVHGECVVEIAAGCGDAEKTAQEVDRIVKEVGQRYLSFPPFRSCVQLQASWLST